MQRKNKTKIGKVAIALLVAFVMIGVPANVFAGEQGDGGSGDMGPANTDVLYGESGTPPYSPTSYGRNEDHRHVEETGWYDEYNASQRAGQVPPDVDVTYLNTPDPTTAHETSETYVEATITNWDDVPHNARIYAQIYEEVEFDSFVIWDDDMESCCVNWTTEDVDGDGNTWDRTDVRSNSPDHSWHNVQD
ncbi:MAG: hypothetical protein ACP5FL_07735 [Thermoplasmatota archaeon]